MVGPMKLEDLSKPTIGVAYVQLSLQLGTERGISHEVLLKDLGIGTLQLAQPDGRVPFLQYGRLCARLLRLTGETGLGLEFGLRTTLTTHGLISYGAMCQATLREALQFTLRFAPRLMSPGFSLRSFEEDRSAVIDLSETVQYGPLHQYAVDMHLSATAMMLRQQLPGLDMELWFKCEEPTHFARYRNRLPLARFGMGANQIRFAAADLDQPLATANAVTAQLVRGHCEQESSRIAVPEDFIGRVRALLVNERQSYPDLETLARELHVSARTLKRRLHDQGFSYKRLLDEARQRDATRLLKETALSVEQIAARLGYSDAANFSRAFRRVTGAPPSSVRAAG